MCDETDLDILNTCMDTLVECFHSELLPVAPELAARLVIHAPSFVLLHRLLIYVSPVPIIHAPRGGYA